MTRYFFALDIIQADKVKLHQYVSQQFPNLKKPVALDNLHVTLAFLGGFSEPQKASLIDYAHRLSAQTNTALTLTFNHLGVFKRAKVLYFGLKTSSSHINNLANQLSAQASKLGLFQENRPYHPHLTIARKVSECPVYQPFEITISMANFSLYQSDSSANGVIYTPVNNFLL